MKAIEILTMKNVYLDEDKKDALIESLTVDEKLYFASVMNERDEANGIYSEREADDIKYVKDSYIDDGDDYKELEL